MIEARRKLAIASKPDRRADELLGAAAELLFGSRGRLMSTVNTRRRVASARGAESLAPRVRSTVHAAQPHAGRHLPRRGQIPSDPMVEFPRIATVKIPRI
jgi:hypothetical protein